MRSRLCLILLLLITAPSFTAPAVPANKESIRAELTRPVPNCDDVAENAARLILKNPANSESILTEWKELCGNSMLYSLYELAGKLETLTKNSPELNDSLWATINTYGKHKRNSRRHPELAKLLKQMAVQAKPASDDGKLLQTWFISGHYGLRSEVVKMPQSRLYTFYRAEREAVEQGLSFGMAFTSGAWFPTGNLARLGNHPAFGFNMLVGYDHFYFGLVFDFRFVNAPADYSYFNPNTNAIERTNTFFSLFFGPDFRWEMWRAEQFSVFLLAGMGYDMLTHYAAQRYSRDRPAFSDSLNLNAGLAFRYYFSEEKTGYLDLELRYHYVDYSNGGKGGDDFSGRYFTAQLAIGYKLSFEGI